MAWSGAESHAELQAQITQEAQAHAQMLQIQQLPPHEQQRMLTQEEIQQMQDIWVPQPLEDVAAAEASMRDWHHLAELVHRQDRHVAIGAEEVHEAHEQSAIAVLFLPAGQFPQVEALAPRMAAAGLTCHVIGDRHILFEEIMTLGLAAILHRPLSTSDGGLGPAVSQLENVSHSRSGASESTQALAEQAMQQAIAAGLDCAGPSLVAPCWGVAPCELSTPGAIGAASDFVAQAAALVEETHLVSDSDAPQAVRSPWPSGTVEPRHTSPPTDHSLASVPSQADKPQVIQAGVGDPAEGSGVRRLADSSAREGTLAEGVVPVTDANVQFSHPCDPAAAVNVTADSSTSSSTGAETHDSPELVNVELPPISGITESVTDHQASLSGLPEHSTLHETEEVVTGIEPISAATNRDVPLDALDASQVQVDEGNVTADLAVQRGPIPQVEQKHVEVELATDPESPQPPIADAADDEIADKKQPVETIKDEEVVDSSASRTTLDKTVDGPAEAGLSGDVCHEEEQQQAADRVVDSTDAVVEPGRDTHESPQGDTSSSCHVQETDPQASASRKSCAELSPQRGDSQVEEIASTSQRRRDQANEPRHADTAQQVDAVASKRVGRHDDVMPGTVDLMSTLASDATQPAGSGLATASEGSPANKGSVPKLPTAPARPAVLLRSAKAVAATSSTARSSHEPSRSRRQETEDRRDRPFPVLREAASVSGAEAKVVTGSCSVPRTAREPEARPRSHPETEETEKRRERPIPVLRDAPTVSGAEAAKVVLASSSVAWSARDHEARGRSHAETEETEIRRERPVPVVRETPAVSSSADSAKVVLASSSVAWSARDTEAPGRIHAETEEKEIRRERPVPVVRETPAVSSSADSAKVVTGSCSVSRTAREPEARPRSHPETEETEKRRERPIPVLRDAPIVSGAEAAKGAVPSETVATVDARHPKRAEDRHSKRDVDGVDADSKRHPLKRHADLPESEERVATDVKRHCVKRRSPAHSEGADTKRHSLRSPRDLRPRRQDDSQRSPKRDSPTGEVSGNTSKLPLPRCPVQERSTKRLKPEGASRFITDVKRHSTKPMALARLCHNIDIRRIPKLPLEPVKGVDLLGLEFLARDPPLLFVLWDAAGRLEEADLLEHLTEAFSAVDVARKMAEGARADDLQGTPEIQASFPSSPRPRDPRRPPRPLPERPDSVSSTTQPVRVDESDAKDATSASAGRTGSTSSASQSEGKDVVAPVSGLSTVNVIAREPGHQAHVVELVGVSGGARGDVKEARQEIVHPVTVQPVTARPDNVRPEVARPEPVRTEVARAESVRSEVVRPQNVRPEVIRPLLVRPEVARPESVRSEVIRPQLVRPEVARPESVRSEVIRPQQVRSEVARPESARSEVGRPNVVRPEVARPQTFRPEVARPESVRSEPVRSQIIRPEVARPELGYVQASFAIPVRPLGSAKAPSRLDALLANCTKGCDATVGVSDMPLGMVSVAGVSGGRVLGDPRDVRAATVPAPPWRRPPPVTPRPPPPPQRLPNPLPRPALHSSISSC